ncbi:MAG: DUF721 domain-containing protein [Hyphomicrobiaceae bacterium]|nr:DUF721 domain-containing protein [Hyphomicrobiaceae bacterium]
MAKAVASFIPKITEKAFEKHGFAAASLIMDWPAIVGHDLAALTRPDRLKWPRGVATFAETDPQAKGRPAATLFLKVDPAAALDIQYRAQQIIERVNAYFGYAAVSALRIIQQPIEFEGASKGGATPAAAHAKTAVKPVPQRPEDKSSASNDSLEQISDDGLREALRRLGSNIRGAGTCND